MLKNLPATAGDLRDMGLIPESGRSPGGRRGSPLQDSCLEDPVDKEAWGASAHGVTQRHTRLKQLNTQQHVFARTYCELLTCRISHTDYI